jgi:phosphopentomutase
MKYHIIDFTHKCVKIKGKVLFWNGGFMIKRVIFIVLDSVGIGEMEDSHEYGDFGVNTIINVARKSQILSIPNLIKLGLSNIDGVDFFEKEINPLGIYGKSRELSKGKDTTTGHWEMVGIHTKNPFPVYKNGFSQRIIDLFLKETKLKGILGNEAASGTEIINRLGDEHRRTGYPIIYTSADSVFQIACDESIYPIEKLYEFCAIAREILMGEDEVSRVIARPFIKVGDEFVRTSNRRDYSIEPPKNNLLTYLKEAGYEVCGIGKIEDIFAKVGITKSIHTTDNMDGVDKTILMMDSVEKGLIFTNLVEFDSKWGHRNDVFGYAKGLNEFDLRLPEIIDKLKSDDILIITADHGCDPTVSGTDHTREFVPVLLYGESLKSNINLHILDSFSDIGQTISEIFSLKILDIGESFLEKIIKEEK